MIKIIKTCQDKYKLTFELDYHLYRRTIVSTCNTADQVMSLRCPFDKLLVENELFVHLLDRDIDYNYTDCIAYNNLIHPSTSTIRMFWDNI